MLNLSSRLVSRRTAQFVAPSLRTPLVRPAAVRFASGSAPSDEDKLKEIVEKLQANPEITAILQDFQKMIVDKGFDALRPPLMMEMMRLFSQKDVREKAGELKAKLDEAGIVLSPEHIGLFMNGFKK